MMKKHYTVATTPNGIADVIIELEEMIVYDNLYEIVNLLNKYQEYVEELEEERMNDAKEFSKLYRKAYGLNDTRRLLKNTYEQLKQANNKIDMLQKRNRRLFYLEMLIRQILPTEKQEELYDKLYWELVR